MNRIPLGLALLSLVFGAAVVTTSCLGDTAQATVTTACVPFDPADPDDPFVVVSEVLERRCGTLDCHGQPARPLRIYGNTGLRRPEPEAGTEDCAVDADCGAGRRCEIDVGCVDAAIDEYAQYYPGGTGTTPSERLENWQSLCGLEPELVTVVYCCSVEKGRCNGFDYDATCGEPDTFDVERLTLVRKARLREKHKGGLVWNEGDDGDVCLTSWLTGDYDEGAADPTACINELSHL